MSTSSPAPRRRFLRLGLAASAALTFSGLGRDEAMAAAARPRSLKLHHLHTGERLETVFFAGGRHLDEGLAATSHLLRDWRADAVHPIDPALLDLLWLLSRRLRYTASVEIVCGYRSPATNAWLARHTDGVAANSFHMSGMALDFRLPGRPLHAVRAAAARLGLGGVGYYPRGQFLHVDTGPLRGWVG